MCERRLGWPRPRWGTLYGIVGAATLAAAFTRMALPASLLRAGILLAIPAMAAVALAAWMVTNRVALDLTEWCDCARSSLRVRIVVASAPPLPPVAARGAHAVERTTLQA